MPISSLSALRPAALLLASVLLAACAGKPTAPPPPQTPPATPKPITGADVIRELGAKGWQYMGTSGATGDPNLVFIRPSSYQQDKDLTRITTISVYGNEGSRNNGNNRAAALVWELNCKGRTARITQQQVFRDPLASVVVSNMAIPNAQPLNISPSTVPALIHSRVCESGPSSGTGVAIAPGRVLTASHVINRCTAIEAVFEGQRHPAQTLAQDTKNDLGLLEVKTLPARATPALRRAANNGESVMAAGYPLSGILSRDMIVTTGIVNSLAGLGNNPNQLQISAQVSPGNSGGALIDKSGNLIGIVVSKLDVMRVAATTGDMAQNVNFAVKPELIRLFVEAHGTRMEPVDASLRLESEDLALRARDFTVKIECKSRPPAILSASR